VEYERALMYAVWVENCGILNFLRYKKAEEFIR